MFLALPITRQEARGVTLAYFVYSILILPLLGQSYNVGGIDTTNQINYPECSELVYTYYTAG